MANIDTLHNLFLMGMRMMYDAEKQIAAALPKMAESASNPDLKRSFEEHLTQTEEQIGRLERAFESLQEDPKGMKCVGIAGIIEEGNMLMGMEMPDPVMDMALAGAAQKVEHYEIAGYNDLLVVAKLHGHDDALELLQQNLSEEEETDERLSTMSEDVLGPACEEAEE